VIPARLRGLARNLTLVLMLSASRAEPMASRRICPSEMSRFRPPSAFCMQDEPRGGGWHVTDQVMLGSLAEAEDVVQEASLR
jgi:hypothetical protein